MSKISFNKGNHDFNGYQVTTDLPVDKIKGTEFTLTQRQLVTSTDTSLLQFGDSCLLSEDGLYMLLSTHQSNPGIIVFYTRPNTNSSFTFSSNIAGPGTNAMALYSLGMSRDAKYIIFFRANGTSYIYSRNTTTNDFTVQFSGTGGANGAAMSSDGNYAFIYKGSSPNTIYPFRRTPGTDSWTALSTFPPNDSSSLSLNVNNMDCSSTGDRFIVSVNSGIEIWRRSTDTTWVHEQTIGTDEGNAQMNNNGDLVAIQPKVSNIEIYTRSGTTWTQVFSIDQSLNTKLKLTKDGNRLFVCDNTTVNGNTGQIRIYNRITDSNWELVNSLGGLGVNNLGGANLNGPGSHYPNFDGSTFIVSSSSLSGSYVYDISNEVEFEERINTKILNFNDTLKITSAFDSADHLVTFPPFNQAGSLLNDGSGNCSWGEPFDQSLNKSDAVQFDCIGLSPNLGQTTTGAELQLSFRKINESYSGNCIKLRRGTDFTVTYTLDTELDDSSNLTGAATYNSTGGSSSRGQFTATLSTSGTFIIDGDTLTSSDDGTRILFIGQNNQDENGIWTTTISGTSLTLDRSTDFDGDGDVSNGDSFYVTAGSSYADTGFKITTEDPITIGGASGSDLTFSNIDVLKDIGFDPDNTGSGIIDLASVSTMLENDNGYIHTWYDQSGNGNDFTQTTQANQPRLLLNGGINWLPTASFDGTDDNLDAGDVLDISTNVGWYVNLVAETNDVGGALISKSHDSDGNRWGIAYSSGPNFDIIYEDSVDSSTSNSQTNGEPEIISFILDRNSGTQTLNSYIDNTNIDSDVAITENSSYNFNSTTSALLGAIDDSGFTYFTGYISEVIIHSYVLSNNERVGIEQEQANYYGITISEMPKLNLKIDRDISSNYSLTFPANQGSNNQVLYNDGSGNLNWRATVRTETTTTTLANDHILNMNNGSTATVNVPDATASSSLGVEYVIIKQTANQVDVTSVVASQLFSGGSLTTTISLTGAAGEHVVLLCNGVYWFVM